MTTLSNYTHYILSYNHVLSDTDSHSYSDISGLVSKQLNSRSSLFIRFLWPYLTPSGSSIAPLSPLLLQGASVSDRPRNPSILFHS